MPVTAHHFTDSAQPTTVEKIHAAELSRQFHRIDEIVEASAKIVELNVFKKTTPASTRDWGAILDDRSGLSGELANSLLEELQQARFREARNRKRIENLERELRVARTRNDVLRASLHSEQNAAGTTSDGAGGPRLSASKTMETIEREGAVEVVGRHKLGRSIMRLLRRRDRAECAA